MESPELTSEAENSRRRRRIRSKVIFGIVVTLLLVAGVSYGAPRWLVAHKDEKFLRAVALKKENSFRERENEKIAGEKAADYLANRTFFVIEFGGMEIKSDVNEMTFEFVPNASKRFPYGRLQAKGRDKTQNAGKKEDGEKKGEGEAPGGSHGSAAAISDDGYFLTNAHVVENEEDPVYLWGSTKQGERLQRARVVWRGDWGHFELPDMALLHADIPASGYFPLRDGNDLPPVGEVLFTGGFGGLTPAQSAGRMEQHGIKRKWEGNVFWRALIHSAPILPGDSGGPVVDRNGDLVGINARLHPDAHWSREGHKEFKARALRPYGNWLEQLIAEDRAARESREL